MTETNSVPRIKSFRGGQHGRQYDLADESITGRADVTMQACAGESCEFPLLLLMEKCSGCERTQPDIRQDMAKMCIYNGVLRLNLRYPQASCIMEGIY